MQSFDVKSSAIKSFNLKNLDSMNINNIDHGKEKNNEMV